LKVGEVGHAFGLELLQIASFLVGLPVFPAAEEEADPNATKIGRNSVL